MSLDPSDGHWLTTAGMQVVLRGRCPSENEVLKSRALWREESRTGLERQQQTRTARESMLYSSTHVRLELTRFRAQVMAFAGAGAVSARSSPGRPAAVGWLEPLDDRGPRIDQSERGVEPRHRDVRVRRHCGRRRRAGADRGATRDAAPYDADA